MRIPARCGSAPAGIDRGYLKVLARANQSGVGIYRESSDPRVGPGDIARAHTKDEWIELGRAHLAPEAYYRIAKEFGTQSSHRFIVA